jgi:pyruvate dehydrogenase E2 component (dihydrolipoamide acetyltransferase)
VSERKKLRGWRKIANAMWSEPRDPQIYGAIEIDATSMLRFIDGCRSLGHKVTPTHLVGRAVALMLRDVPVLNVRIVGGETIQRDSADVFFIAAVEGGRELSGVKIERLEHKDVVDLAAELAERAARMRSGDDPELGKSKGALDALPLPLLRLAMRLTAYVTSDRDRSIDFLGLKRTPFGSAIVTSVGMFGIPMGFAPIASMERVPLLVLVGAVAEKPVVIDGKIEIRSMLPVTATIDHRYVDGWHISRAMRTFRSYLESPASFETDVARRINARAAARPS